MRISAREGAFDKEEFAGFDVSGHEKAPAFALDVPDLYGPGVFGEEEGRGFREAFLDAFPIVVAGNLLLAMRERLADLAGGHSKVDAFLKVPLRSFVQLQIKSGLELPVGELLLLITSQGRAVQGETVAVGRSW